MTQGIARKLTSFSAMSFSLFASLAVHAQLIEVETPPTDGEEQAAAQAPAQTAAPQAVPQALLQVPSAPTASPAQQPVAQRPVAQVQAQSPVQTQPVAVSSAMVPATVPQAQPVAAPQAAQVAPVAMQSQSQTQSQGYSPAQAQAVQAANNALTAAPSLPQTANANSNSGSGQQIIIVPTLSANQTASQDAEQNIDPLGGLRMDRARREGFNDGLLLRRIEEGRIQDEKERTKAVDAFSGSVSSGAAASAGASAGVLDSVPVMGEPQASAGATATATATASVSGERSLNGSGTEFKIGYMGGYRWYENNHAQYKVENGGVHGVELEGALTDNFSIEGSFLYGRDSFSPNIAYAGNGYGGYTYAGYNGYNNYNYATTGYNAYAAYGGLLPMPNARDTYEASVGAKLGVNVSKIRPFVALGVGGLFQTYRIDDAQSLAIMEQSGLSRSTNYVLGNFGAGLDGRVARNISLGARFDYQALLNTKPTIYNQIWGDSLNRMRVTGNVSVVF